MDEKERQAALSAWIGADAPICPLMSARVAIPAVSGGGVIQAGQAQAVTFTVKAMPCVGIRCAMAITHENGAFGGCGAAPGQDIVHLIGMLDLRLRDLVDGPAHATAISGVTPSLLQGVLGTCQQALVEFRALAGRLYARMDEAKPKGKPS